MKILEAQNAVLSNFEVYSHLLSEQFKLKDPQRKRKTPHNVQATTKEVLEYLKTSPNPFSQRPITYSATTIGRLVERLRDYDLTKGEMIMILNVRPENGAVLSACVEDFETRFTEDQQNEMQAAIEELLGPFPDREQVASVDAEADADAA